jgi:hypothetical protein
MSRPTKLHWLVGCSSVLLAGLVFGLTLDPASLSPPASQVVSLALFVSLACYLLLPGANGLAMSLVNSICGMALFILLSRLTVDTGIPETILFQVCAIFFCLCMLLLSLTELLKIIFPDSQSLRINIILLVTIISSAPVWLGPIVDIYQLNSLFINGVVSSTPLTHFSVAAEYDYLRGEWLYQHSAFGSLPFVYPSFNSITVCYLLLVSTIRIAIWGLARHPRMLKTLHLAGKNYN